MVKIDLEGCLADETGQRVNPAGFVIHSAIHGARPDVTCVIHMQTKAGAAVAALKCGLLPISQFAMYFHGQLAYHDNEGIALDRDEQHRLAQDLGDKPAMVLRNHGLLTVRSSVAEAFLRMYYLERSCEIQIAAQATGADIVTPSPEVCTRAERQHRCNEDGDGFADRDWQQLALSAMLRTLEREDPDCRQWVLRSA